jgi:hypothetical protein
MMKNFAPLSAVAALFFLQPALAASPNVCDQTTRLLYKACTEDVLDDRLVGYARCANVVDEEAQADCNHDVNEEYAEAAALCKEQRYARFEVCEELGQAAYDQSEAWSSTGSGGLFVSAENIVGNQWFDLTPGTVNHFSGGGEEIEVTVTQETKLIEGVTCRTVRDVVTDEDGNIVEDTDDWYAQDIDGNVWYCGELARNYEFYEGGNPEASELVDLDGSWKAFRDGAQPGVVFWADPMAGDFYRQEAAWGDAEDVARVESVDAGGLLEGDECEDEEATMAVDEYLNDSCNGECLVTLEFTAIEPGVFAHKYYAPGVGLLAEVEDGSCTLRDEE